MKEEWKGERKDWKKRKMEKKGERTKEKKKKESMDR